MCTLCIFSTNYAKTYHLAQNRQIITLIYTKIVLKDKIQVYYLTHFVK